MRQDSRPSGRFRPRYLAALLVVLLAGFLAACGGGGDKEETAGDGTPQAEAAANADATAVAAPEEATGDVSAPSEALTKLQSYHMDLRFTLEGTADQQPGVLTVDVKGTFVAPDRSQASVSASLGDLQMQEESIVIGDKSWVKTGDNWVEGESQFNLAEFSPASLLEGLTLDQLGLLEPSKESVNGVVSLRYSIGQADIENLRNLGAILGQEGDTQDLPEEFNIDLWLAEDGGWPVRMTMTAKGAADTGGDINLDFSLDITDVNDQDTKVEPPQA